MTACHTETLAHSRYSVIIRGSFYSVDRDEGLYVN